MLCAPRKLCFCRQFGENCDQLLETQANYISIWENKIFVQMWKVSLSIAKCVALGIHIHVCIYIYTHFADLWNYISIHTPLLQSTLYIFGLIDLNLCYFRKESKLSFIQFSQLSFNRGWWFRSMTIRFTILFYRIKIK